MAAPGEFAGVYLARWSICGSRVSVGGCIGQLAHIHLSLSVTGAQRPGRLASEVEEEREVESGETLSKVR